MKKIVITFILWHYVTMILYITLPSDLKAFYITNELTPMK